MNDNRTNSGVRNLRAMFENQSAASSPEPRGRSPAGNSAVDDGTSRPTSKVRASFVSVEPSSHIARDLGTSKGTTDGINSTTANRRESFSASQELREDVTAEIKKVVSEEKEARKNSHEVSKVVPEQAVETRESSRDPPPIQETPVAMPNLGSIMKGSDFPEPETAESKPKVEEAAVRAPAEPEQTPANVDKELVAPSSTDAPGDNPDKIVTGVQEEASLKPADPTDKAAVSGGEALPPPTEALPSINATAPETPKAARTPSKAKTNGTPATNGKAATKKPPTISTTKAQATTASSSKSSLPKTPIHARLPKTPTTPKVTPAASTMKSPAPTKAPPKATAPKEAAKPPTPKASRASLRPSTATTAATATTASKSKAPVTESKKPAPKQTTSAPAPKDTNTSPTGFKKPRPKSPTRPVRLPSHLTAPTASYAAKRSDEAATQKLARKPSTVSRPAPKAAPPVRKQPSRASLTPSTAPGKRPDSRASTRGAADEGFLARMMRPTTASASKTHEKPPSPIRKGVSVKAPTKPKSQEGTVTKEKKKVDEVASSDKEAVTNGHGADDHTEEAEDGEPTASNGAATEEPVREATPDEQVVESSAVEIQTPNFEGQEIR